MSESAAWVLTVPCNKGHNQVQSNFAVDLAGCPDSGEGDKGAWSDPSVSESGHPKKSDRKDGG